MSEAPSRAASRRGRTLKLYLVDGSPSGAGSVVFGGNVNGREFWRHAVTGQRYGEWRASVIGSEGAA